MNVIKLCNDSCEIKPHNCKPILSSLRDYSVEQGFMTERESLDLCFVENDQWYYRGKPTCVGSQSMKAWDSCDTNLFLCAGVGEKINHYGYMRSQMSNANYKFIYNFINMVIDQYNLSPKKGILIFL